MDMLTKLSSADITKALSSGRDRGGAEREIRKFVKSGELYMDLRSVPSQTEGKTDSIYNSYNANVKKVALAEKEAGNEDWPELKVTKYLDEDTDPVTDTVLLVNITVHTAANSPEGENGSNESDAPEDTEPTE